MVSHILPTHLNVDGPLESSRQPERLSRVRVLDVAKDEKIEEEPTNHVHQLMVTLPLILIYHVLWDEDT